MEKNKNEKPDPVNPFEDKSKQDLAIKGIPGENKEKIYRNERKGGG